MEFSNIINAPFLILEFFSKFKNLIYSNYISPSNFFKNYKIYNIYIENIIYSLKKLNSSYSADNSNSNDNKLYQEMTQKLASLLETSCHYYNNYKKATQNSNSDKKQKKSQSTHKIKYEKLVIETNEDEDFYKNQNVRKFIKYLILFILQGRSKSEAPEEKENERKDFIGNLKTDKQVKINKN